MRWWPFRRRDRVRVDIDPAQLIVVHFLLRFRAAPQDRLYEEVRTTSGLDHGTFMLSLAELASKGLIEPRFQPEDGETWFVLSDLGRRLRGKLPKSSRSALAIY